MLQQRRGCACACVLTSETWCACFLAATVALYRSTAHVWRCSPEPCPAKCSCTAPDRIRSLVLGQLLVLTGCQTSPVRRHHGMVSHALCIALAVRRRSCIALAARYRLCIALVVHRLGMGCASPFVRRHGSGPCVAACASPWVSARLRSGVSARSRSGRGQVEARGLCQVVVRLRPWVSVRSRSGVSADDSDWATEVRVALVLCCRRT